MRLTPSAACLALAFLLALTFARASVTPAERAQGFAEGVVIAKPRADLAAAATAHEARARARVRAAYPRFGDVRILELAAGESVSAAVARFRATGLYEFVEPDYLMTEDAVPNDPRFPSQWALHNTAQPAPTNPGTAGADIKAPAAWDIRSRAPDVIVAVLDSGIRSDHEDIAANLWQNPAPTIGDVNGIRIIRGVRTSDITDDTGHGSHVAGIIGAVGNNDVGIAGVAWQVKLMICKNGVGGGSFTSDSAACLDYAVANGARIVNCSFGGTSSSQTFLTAIRAARQAGVIVVTSAGNAGTNNDLAPHYPSNYLVDNIVSVGNSTPTDGASASSDYGATVDLFAPGSSIVSLAIDSPASYTTRSGTSMAAPHVTGALALLRAQFPADTHTQLINRLLRSADLRTSLAGRAITNARLNLQAALASTSNRPFNDDFARSAIITGGSFSVRANNRDATNEPTEPAHPNATSTGTLWYNWIPGTSGTVTFTTAGSDIDTSLVVYSGSALNALTVLASNDDDAARLTSRVAFEATAGTSYRISVAGKNGATGFIQLNVGTAPVNDAFAAATILSGQSATATTRMPSATVEPGEAGPLDRPAIATVWYRWTAPRHGRFQLSAFSSDFDTLLAVYTGPALGALTRVAANDDTGLGDIANTDSRVTLDATAGTTYHIQVDRKVPGETGEVIVTLVDSAWQFSADFTTTTAPAVAPDGTIYFGTLGPDRRVYALDASGNLKWTWVAGGSIDTSAVAIANDGTIYVGAADGRLTALNSAGTVRWSRSFGTLPAANVAVTPSIAADGTIYTHSYGGRLHALNPASGSDKWSFDIGPAVTFASASIAPDGTIYQVSNAGLLHAVNPDGTPKWQFDLGGNSFATPALDTAGNLYVTTAAPNGRVVSLTPQGALRWSYSALAPIQSSPTLSADGATVYLAGGADRRLHAVDTANGVARWTYLLPNLTFGSTPAVDSEGVIYVGCFDARLYAINPAGTLKRVYDTAQPVQSSPAIVGGMLYVTSRDAKLYAFQLAAGAASGPWPQYAQNPRRTGRALPAAVAFATTPQPRNARSGDTVTLSATPAAPGASTYQWFKDGAPLAGATAATLTLAGVSPAEAGLYSVRLTQATGTLTSPAALLSVEASDPGRLVNLSILTALAGAGDSFTMGYVAGGAGTTGGKPILARVAGPALGGVGVSGFAEDPRLELFSGTTSQAANDNWAGTPALLDAFARVAAFPFGSATSRDAALTATLSGSNTSVRVSATDNGSGLVLAELYDLTPTASITTTTPRLVNVSVLKHLGPGVTVGFVIGGTGPRRVLIRAVGPTLGLAPFGVPGVVADPQLTLFAGALRIDENNNWSGTAELSAAFAATGAFPLAATSRDAALVTTLAPGAYTVRVTGAGTTTGTALVEVYEVR